MKIGKQLIIPVAIIIILGLYIGINKSGKMNYKVPVFTVIDKQDIDTIEIDGLINPLNLYSDNGTWKFNPGDLRAEPSKIDEMLSFLADPNFIDMVSDSVNYQNYGLGEEEHITVRAWKSSNNTDVPDRELFIGDRNTSGSFTFIRRPDNPGVFTAKGSIRGLFDATQKDLIDKRILDMDIPGIDKIELSFSNVSFTLEKSVGDNNEDKWNTSEGTSIESKNLDQSLRYLSNSRFNSYTDDKMNAAVGSIFSINVIGENLTGSFSIIDKIDDGYYCESSFAGKSFILSENTGTQIVKMFNDVLNIKEE